MAFYEDGPNCKRRFDGDGFTGKKLSRAEKAYVDRAAADDLRNRLRIIERDLQRNQNMSDPTPEEQRQMVKMQGSADPAYQVQGLRAPQALPSELPDEYRRRLADGLKSCHPQWNAINLDDLEDAAFDIAERQIYAAALASGPQDLQDGEMREVMKMDNSGHRRTEFFGKPGVSFVKQFTRPARRAKLKSWAAYQNMTRDAQLARLSERVRAAGAGYAASAILG